MKINRNAKFLAAVAFCGCFAAPMSAQAQNRWNPNDVRDMIDRTERESNTLRHTFEKDFDRYQLGPINRAERAKDRIQKLDESFERLRFVADEASPRHGRKPMRDIVRYGNDVNRIFLRHPEIRETVRGQWWSLRDDINALARIFHVPTIEVPRRGALDERPRDRGF